MNGSFIFGCWQQVLNWAVIIAGAIVIVAILLVLLSCVIKVVSMFGNWINKE